MGCGWDVDAVDGLLRPALLLPPSDTGATSRAPSAVRVHARATEPTSCLRPIRTPRGTACVFPLLRSLSKACFLLHAFGERANLSTMSPVCSVNYLPGLYPTLTRHLRAGLSYYAAPRLAPEPRPPTSRFAFYSLRAKLTKLM